MTNPLTKYELSVLRVTGEGRLFKTWNRPRSNTVRNLMLKGLIVKEGTDWKLTPEGWDKIDGVIR